MKKLSLLVAFTLLSIGLVYGQSLDMNYITFHGSDGETDDVFSAGETVTVRTRYDGVSMQQITGVYQDSGQTNTGYIYVFWYIGTPDGSPDGSNIVAITNFNYSGLGTDGYADFDFTLPTPSSGATTFQLGFGIYGEGGGWRATVFSSRYTSYATVSPLNVCSGDTADGESTYVAEWETYGELDGTTETPTLTEPDDGDSDNASMYIAFNLPENATSGSVKLYIDDDTNHTNGYFNVLTLLNTYITSGNHDMYINGGDLDDDPQAGDATDDVTSVSTPGNNALVNGNTYYMAIAYRDETGNTEAKSAWAEFTYDTSITNVSSAIATDLDLDEVQLSYYLPECSQDWKVTFCFDTDTNYGNGYTSEIVLGDETHVGSAGTRTVYFNGNELSTTDYYISHSGAEAGSLTSGTQYYVGVQYTDCAGNTSSITYSGVFTYLYDTQTDQAINIDADIEANTSEGPVLDIDYELEEDGLSNSVYILIDDDISHGTNGEETTSDVLYIIQISGNYTTGTHNFNLSVPFVTADAGGDGDQVVAISTLASSPYDLTDGSTYYMSVRYTDETENPAVTTEPWVSFTWDGVTETPSWDGSQPTADNRAFSFVYDLPEDGEANSVRIQIDNNSDHGTLWATLNITGHDEYNTNSFIVDANQLNDGSMYSDGTDDVSNTPSQSALIQGSNYYYRVGYQDEWGNAYAYTDWMQILFDNVTLTPTLDLPNASSTFTTNFTLQYDLPETAYEGSLYVMFTRTSGTTDSNSPHKLEIVSETSGSNIQITGLDPTNLTSSAAIDNTPISGTGVLVDGTIYTITIGYQDLLLNTEATDSHTNCEYSSGAAVMQVVGRAIDNIPLEGPSNTNQLIFAFDLNTTSGSADFSGISLSRSGSSALADFSTGSFKIWLDDGDDVFEPAQDDDMSAAGGYSDWPGGAFANPVVISGTTAVSIDSSGETFWITVDQSATSNKLHSIRLSISSTVAVTSDADETTGNFPINGLTHDLDGYVIIDVDDTFGGYVNPGNNRAIHKFSMKTNQGSTTVSSITVDFSGDGALSTNFLGSTPMKIWSSEDESFYYGTDLQVGGPIAYNNTLTFTWSARALLDVDETELWYFVTGDVNPDGSGAIQGAMDEESVVSAYGIETDIGGNEEWDEHTDDITLPVELSTFTIFSSNRLVTIEWTTESETDNLGFNVYRGLSVTDMEDETVIKLNAEIIPGAGTSSEPTDYVFTDDYRIEYGETYYYWLESVELGGYAVLFSPKSHTPQPTGGTDTPDVTFYGMRNYPNPFNPSTKIEFCLTENAHAKLDIYNVRGQFVKNLFNGDVSADVLNGVYWDGTDESGKETSSGVYYYRLQHGSKSELKKMILLR